MCSVLGTGELSTFQIFADTVDQLLSLPLTAALLGLSTGYMLGLATANSSARTRGDFIKL